MVKYTYEAMVRIEVLPPRQFTCVEEGASTVYSNNALRCPILGDDLIRGAQLSDSLSIGGNLVVLVAWILLLRVAGYFALNMLHTDHKPKVAARKKLRQMDLQ